MGLYLWHNCNSYMNIEYIFIAKKVTDGYIVKTRPAGEDLKYVLADGWFVTEDEKIINGAGWEPQSEQTPETEEPLIITAIDSEWEGIEKDNPNDEEIPIRNRDEKKENRQIEGLRHKRKRNNLDHN